MDKLLEQLGLSAEEIIVYKALLKLGGAKVSQIAGLTGLRRTSVQEYVRSLFEKSFVNSTKIGNKYFYQTEDPDKIRQTISEREFVVDRLAAHLEKQKAAPKPWQACAIDTDDARLALARARKKGRLVKGFGDMGVGGALIGQERLVLWGEDRELPALELESREICDLVGKLVN